MRRAGRAAADSTGWPLIHGLSRVRSDAIVKISYAHPKIRHRSDKYGGYHGSDQGIFDRRGAGLITRHGDQKLMDSCKAFSHYELLTSDCCRFWQPRKRV
jgi:hypothetical protein